MWSDQILKRVYSLINDAYVVSTNSNISKNKYKK